MPQRRQMSSWPRIGIFDSLAQQEAAIRQDPARRTTELLRRVFGT